jgi:hypothetical protein
MRILVLFAIAPASFASRELLAGNAGGQLAGMARKSPYIRDDHF